MLAHNPAARRIPYPAELQAILSHRGAALGRQWLANWPLLRPGPTPLVELPGLAARFGLARLAIKDEAVRSPLASFKALGAPLALMHLAAQRLPDMDPGRLMQGGYRRQLAGLTVISATDGNHGRALAAAAHSVGCRCVIVLHAGVSAERERAIAAYGAEIVRIAGDYDDSVAHAAELAAARGWQVVSDTSWDGYEAVPRDVMQGYGIIAAEVVAQSGARPEQPAFTHLLLQGGVGGLAAGVVAHFWEYHGARRPRCVVVEPEAADCLYRSALAGGPAAAAGPVDSLMAGLACGQASPLAWRILAGGGDDFLTIGDDNAVGAMQLLAAGSAGDMPLVAGESGAAGLAALLALARRPDQAAALGLDRQARVLLINTEGATAPALYRQLTGCNAAAVEARQADWLAAAGG